MNRPHQPLYISLAVNTLLFTLLLAFCRPIYHSGDDVFLLYLLGGGFGSAPTDLLHYNHIMHPWLGFWIKSLFQADPGINWYSVFLYSSQWLACVVIFSVLLRRLGLRRALLVFIPFFLGVAAWFLLLITFSVTALMLALAGIFLLLDRAGNPFSLKKWVAPLLLILLAALFRIHVLIPVALIAAPLCLCFSGWAAKARLLAFGLLAALLILGLNRVQQYQYRSRIPGWQQEEAYRQAVFNYFNYPVRYDSAAYSTPRAMLEYAIYLDKQYLSPRVIDSLGARVHYSRSFFSEASRGTLYWLLVESRVFLAVFLFSAALAFIQAGRSKKYWIALSGLAALGLLAILYQYLKLPFYLVPGLLGAGTILPWAVAGGGARPWPRYWRKGLPAIALLLGAWGLIRVIKTDRHNREQSGEFLQAYRQTAAHPDKLFVVTEDLFPMDYFSVFYTPREYPLHNLLYKDLLFNNAAGPVLAGFGLKAEKEIFSSDKVLFWGRQTRVLEDYMRQAYGREIRFSEPLPGFPNREVRKMVNP